MNIKIIVHMKGRGSWFILKIKVGVSWLSSILNYRPIPVEFPHIGYDVRDKEFMKFEVNPYSAFTAMGLFGAECTARSACIYVQSDLALHSLQLFLPNNEIPVSLI